MPLQLATMFEVSNQVSDIVKLIEQTKTNFSAGIACLTSIATGC